MLSLLRNLFGRSRSLESLALRADRAAFLDRLRDADIFVIAAIEGDGFDTTKMTPDELLSAMRAAAESLSRREGFDPHVYERDGRRRLPFFTNQAHGQTFAGEYCKARGRTFPIELLGIRGHVLARILPACDDLVMNDSTAVEYTLPTSDLDAIRREWAS